MWSCTTQADAGDVQPYRPTPKGVLRGVRVTWQSGSLYERFFIAWVFGGFATYFFLLVWLALWMQISFGDWRRMSLPALHAPVTFLAAIWAWESAPTLRALLAAGLEHPNLTKMKAEYLERYGESGANPTARRWAFCYISIYLAWTGVVVWAAGPLGWDLWSLGLVHAALVISLAVAITWRISAYYRRASARGYPVGELALQLRREHVRW